MTKVEVLQMKIKGKREEISALESQLDELSQDLLEAVSELKGIPVDDLFVGGWDCTEINGRCICVWDNYEACVFCGSPDERK